VFLSSFGMLTSFYLLLLIPGLVTALLGMTAMIWLASPAAAC
jgi:UPF0716 family protein affecting phage T7 exclusion